MKKETRLETFEFIVYNILRTPNHGPLFKGTLVTGTFYEQVPAVILRMEDSRPGQLTLGVKFCVKPDFQFENGGA